MSYSGAKAARYKGKTFYLETQRTVLHCRCLLPRHVEETPPRRRKSKEF
jgi:hypothetical protein